MSRLPRPGPGILVTTGVVVLAVALAGCGPDPVEWPDDPTPEAPPAPAVSPADEAEAATIEEILALLHGFREAEVRAHADPQPPHLARRQLAGYLADPLLSRTLGTLDAMVRAGVVFEGRPTWEPTVVELRLDETPPTAAIHDCLDTTGWRSVFQETGNPVPADDLPDRYVVRVEAKLFPDGWLLHDARMEEDLRC